MNEHGRWALSTQTWRQRRSPRVGHRQQDDHANGNHWTTQAGSASCQWLDVCAILQSEKTKMPAHSTLSSAISCHWQCESWTVVSVVSTIIDFSLNGQRAGLGEGKLFVPLLSPLTARLLSATHPADPDPPFLTRDRRRR